MTVSDPGAGQQPGREVCVCGHDKDVHDFWDDQGACAAMRPDGLDYIDGCMTYDPAPSSAPPAQDSGFTPCTDPVCPPLPGGLTHGHGTAPTPARDSGRDEAREALARWRTGRKVGRTIYAQAGFKPSDDDALIGVMDTAELAQAAVDGHNRLLDGAR